MSEKYWKGKFGMRNFSITLETKDQFVIVPELSITEKGYNDAVEKLINKKGVVYCAPLTIEYENKMEVEERRFILENDEFVVLKKYHYKDGYMFSAEELENY